MSREVFASRFTSGPRVPTSFLHFPLFACPALSPPLSSSLSFNNLSLQSTEGRWEFKEGSSVGDEVLDAAYFHDQDNVREWGRRPPNDLDAINDGGPRK